jgi:hypothetical protein
VGKNLVGVERPKYASRRVVLVEVDFGALLKAYKYWKS